MAEFKGQLAIGGRDLRRGGGDSCYAQKQELFLFPGLRWVGLRQTVVAEGGCSIRGREAVGQCCKVAVAGVGERFLGGEGYVGLRMRAGQVPVATFGDDVQVSAAKDRGLRQEFV